MLAIAREPDLFYIAVSGKGETDARMAQQIDVVKDGAAYGKT